MYKIFGRSVIVVVFQSVFYLEMYQNIIIFKKLFLISVHQNNLKTPKIY